MGDETPRRPTNWASLQIENELAIPFSLHAEPTEAYGNFTKTIEASLIEPFTDHADLFRKSHDIAMDMLPSRTKDDLLDVTTEYFHGELDAYTECFNNQAEVPEKTKEAVIHAIRLANTSPDLFGPNCLRLDSSKGDAIFKLEPLSGDVVHASIAHERHDMVQWLACFSLFGKTFSMDGWNSVLAESLMAPLDPSQPVMRIKYGQEEFLVSREAKDAMSQAVGFLANKPTVYFRQKFVMDAVMKTLNKDVLQLSMPQSQNELKSFNWDNVIPGRAETYPKGHQPSPKEFQKVKVVHEEVKKEKDEAARAIGSSGVQSYISFKQRWAQWRDIHAIYRAMMPSSSLQMVADMAMGRLKACKSLDKIYAVIQQDVQSHIEKLKREAKKKEKADEMKRKEAEVAAEEQMAQQTAQELQEEQTRLQEQQEQLQAEVETEVGGGVNTSSARQTRNTRRISEQAKRKALADKEKEAADVEKRLQLETEKARKKAEEKENLAKQRREVVNQEVEEPTKKRAKRTDVERLQDDMTPRDRFKYDGALWAPPMRSEASGVAYLQPGAQWAREARKKLALLTSLRSQLKIIGLCEQPMTFVNVMEFVLPDDSTIHFESRVFLYLVALMIAQKSSFDDMVSILLALVENELTSAEAVCEVDADTVQELIAGFDDKNLVGAAIFAVAMKLNTDHNGIVPRDKDGLLTIKLDDTVASLLMQHVFGSTELIVGLHARKILTALDMVDWEETGATVKKEVKMVSLPPKNVKKSLRTWLPKGEAVGFHDTMDTIGSLIAAPQSGEWGRLKAAINTSFATKDKEKLNEMVAHISQMYRATRSGGKRKVAC